MGTEPIGVISKTPSAVVFANREGNFFRDSKVLELSTQLKVEGIEGAWSMVEIEEVDGSFFGIVANELLDEPADGIALAFDPHAPTTNDETMTVSRNCGCRMRPIFLIEVSIELNLAFVMDGFRQPSPLSKCDVFY